MKRRLRLLLGTLFLVPLILGMGSKPGQTPEKIPVPVQKYQGSFMDQTDVLTKCLNISIDGQTFLQGKRGEGNYTIGFDKIASILFRMSEGKLIGMVQLRDGATLELILNGSQKAYGSTQYGTFQIKLQDLKKMTIGAKG